MTDKRPFTGEDLIFVYTRADALADGVLKDLTKLAREAGFKYPTAITAAAWAAAVEPPDDCPGQSVVGRAWDVLQLLRWQAENAGQSDRIAFQLSIQVSANAWHDIALMAMVHPGDEAEPVITVMLPEED